MPPGIYVCTLRLITSSSISSVCIHNGVCLLAVIEFTINIGYRNLLNIKSKVECQVECTFHELDDPLIIMIIKSTSWNRAQLISAAQLICFQIILRVFNLTSIKFYGQNDASVCYCTVRCILHKSKICLDLEYSCTQNFRRIAHCATARSKLNMEGWSMGRFQRSEQPFLHYHLRIEVHFLVHLSRRLKCTIVIMRCPSSVRRR